MQEIKELSN